MIYVPYNTHLLSEFKRHGRRDGLRMEAFVLRQKSHPSMFLIENLGFFRIQQREPWSKRRGIGWEAPVPHKMIHNCLSKGRLMCPHLFVVWPNRALLRAFYRAMGRGGSWVFLRILSSHNFLSGHRLTVIGKSRVTDLRFTEMDISFKMTRYPIFLM